MLVQLPVRPSCPDSFHPLLACFDPGLQFLRSIVSGIEVRMHTARIARNCSGGGFEAVDAASRSPPEVADDSQIIELIADLVCELANSARGATGFEVAVLRRGATSIRHS